jgi:hypothetical protein
MKTVALVLAIAFFILAIVYWLPSGPLGSHVKHGILFAALGLLSLVWMRFQRPGARGTGTR